MAGHEKKCTGTIELCCECCDPAPVCTQLVQFQVDDCNGGQAVVQNTMNYRDLVKSTYGAYSIRGFSAVQIETSGSDTWLLNFIVNVPCEGEVPVCQGAL